MILHSRKGFTIIESVISIGIAALIFASVASVMGSGHYLGANNRSRLYALNGLREELEFLRGMGSSEFDTIDALDGTAFTNLQIGKLDGGAAARDIDASFGADIRRVSLTVTWNSRTGLVMTEGITTYVTRRGINGI